MSEEVKSAPSTSTTMTTPSTASSAAPAHQSGIRTALRYTGIPASWLEKKPRLPSRNWLIFLSVSSSIIGAYVYDRRECKRIREEYVEKVKHLAEERVGPLESGRKVTVYAAKWPGDEDWDQAAKYFRRYVKPILVAAAVDYDIVRGKKQGDITRDIISKIYARRLLASGQTAEHPAALMLPTYLSPTERERKEMEGGIVIIGRHSLKEFLEGIRRGWSGEPVERRQDWEDDRLSNALDADSVFDEPEEPLAADEGQPREESEEKKPLYAPIPRSLSPPSSSQTNPSIPPYPPLLLVPFTNLIGFTKMPLMIFQWFQERKKVQAGAEAAYKLVIAQTAPVVAEELDSETPQPPSVLSTFDLEGESSIKSSLESKPSEIEKEREKYYTSLATKLATARELARGTREATKEEWENPPPTEVELRSERFKKEKRWREEMDGWDIVRPSATLPWDKRLEGVFRVFVHPATEDKKEESS